jgi:hypothetical protein
MRTQSLDTHPEAERVQIALLRLQGAAGRYAWVRSLSRTTVRLACRALRRRWPQAHEREVRGRFMRLNYGPELAAAVEAAWREGNMIAPEIGEAIGPVVQTFERLGIAYAIGGPVASSVHGIPRSTLDADLVADLKLHQVAALVEALEDSYYISEPMACEAIRRHGSFNLIHFATSLKIDIFVLGPRPYDREAFDRRRTEALEEAEGDRQFFVASAEDVILSKLEWYRLGGGVSERQWGDVLGVLKVQGDALDQEYLRRWAAELGLSGLLERGLQDAGLD